MTTLHFTCYEENYCLHFHSPGPCCQHQRQHSPSQPQHAPSTLTSSLPLFWRVYIWNSPSLVSLVMLCSNMSGQKKIEINGFIHTDTKLQTLSQHRKSLGLGLSSMTGRTKVVIYLNKSNTAQHFYNKWDINKARSQQLLELNTIYWKGYFWGKHFIDSLGDGVTKSCGMHFVATIKKKVKSLMVTHLVIGRNLTIKTKMMFHCANPQLITGHFSASFF